MPLIDPESLLAEISAEEPAGPNLEYDPEFASLEQAAAGKPEQQMGDTIVPAEEPDWKAVHKAAQALLTRTKDLRVAVHLARALLRTGGLPAFGEGLSVLRGLVDRYWDTVHPQLDPDDDNDPTMRVNILGGLCDGPTLSAVRAAPLVASKMLGRFGLREVAMAQGELPPPSDQTPPDMKTIEAAFGEVDLGALEVTATGVGAALESARAIESAVGDKVGAGSGPNYAKLVGLLYEANKLVSTRFAQRSGAGAAAGEVSGGDGAAAFAGPGVAVGGSPLAGDIRSRDDVVRALDKIIEYYERCEPSSPVPLFVRRCRRLATMSFVDIVRDMLPEAMAQVELLGGKPPESAESGS